MHPFLCLVPAIVLLSLGAPLPGAELAESFEDGLPASIVATGGKLAHGSDRLLDGKRSLRWDFADGDALVIHTGPLGNVNVYDGYGGYARSALTLPVYLPVQGTGHLLVEIRAGEEVAATITVPFAHVGWQKLVYHYSWQSRLQWKNRALADKLDNLRISAHGIAAPTHAYFDAIVYNSPRDFRDARPAVVQAWRPAVHDFQMSPPPTPADLAKLEALCRALVPAVDGKITVEQWRQRIERARKHILDNGYRRGNPVTRNLATYFDFLNGIAEDWCRCGDPALRGEIAANFHEVNDWLQDQGLVVDGALGQANNYIGRGYVDAVTKMRDALAAHGTLDASIAYLKWSYGYDDQVFGTNFLESMDYFHNEALRLLRIATSHGDPVVRWHHVARFRDTLGRQLAATIKPDGAIFHHGFHYFAYGSMGMNSISGTLAVMSGAGLPVARDGLDAVRRALMAMRWYSGGTTLWSLSGRAAHGTMQPPAGAFLNLARAYEPYLDGQRDRELVNAYLRFKPEAAKQPGFEGFAPEPSPAGFATLPYAALAMHRRGDWLVGIKGYSKHAAAGESYANANRHGLYLSHGQMEILSHPAPLPTVVGSGTRPNDGYNWSAIEGATTIHTPLDRIANGNGTRMPTSPETFAGGVGNGRNGLFAMILNDTSTGQIMRDRPKDAPAPEPLRARKSWFCFDNRIICLGSGITTRGVDYPVRTNLFQRHLGGQFTTVCANGEKIPYAGTAIARDYSGDPVNLTDPYGNYYRTAPGTRVHLGMGPQQSRDSDDSRNTTGDHATAWIEHGNNPDGAVYEYAVLVQATASESAAFAAAPAYTVVRRDTVAHVVRDHASESTGYAVFSAPADLADDPHLRAVAQPCLVLVEEHPGHLLVSVTAPDVRPDAAQAADVTITLRGKYELIPEARHDSGGDTVLTVPVRHAESVTMRMVKPLAK